MKKQIETWSYWLAIISAAVALVMRAFNAFGVFLPGTVIQGTTIWYMSFYKGALLFSLINIATAIRNYSETRANERFSLSKDTHTASHNPAVNKVRTAAASG